MIIEGLELLERRHTLNISFLRWFINDSTVLQASQVEHSNTAIGTAADKHINAVGAEPDIKNFLIVGNQLCLGRQCRDIPDCAGRIDTRCDDQAGGYRVPVQRGDRRGVLG